MVGSTSLVQWERMNAGLYNFLYQTVTGFPLHPPAFGPTIWNVAPSLRSKSEASSGSWTVSVTIIRVRCHPDESSGVEMHSRDTHNDGGGLSK